MLFSACFEFIITITITITIFGLSDFINIIIIITSIVIVMIMIMIVIMIMILIVCESLMYLPWFYLFCPVGESGVMAVGRELMCCPMTIMMIMIIVIMIRQTWYLSNLSHQQLCQIFEIYTPLTLWYTLRQIIWRVCLFLATIVAICSGQNFVWDDMFQNISEIFFLIRTRKALGIHNKQIPSLLLCLTQYYQ